MGHGVDSCLLRVLLLLLAGVEGGLYADPRRAVHFLLFRIPNGRHEGAPTIISRINK